MQAPQASATPRSVDPVDPRIVGYWRFEEGSPDALATGARSVLDSSRSLDHGTPGGSPSYHLDVPGATVPLSGAVNILGLDFGGLDDRVSFPSKFRLNEPGDATVEFWIKHPGDHHEAVMWGRSDSRDTNRFHVYVNTNHTMAADYRNPSGVIHSVSPSVPFSPNLWTHFAITRSGNTYRTYRDGVLMATVVDSSPDLPTSVGWQLSGRTQFEFLGRVDELRLANVALSPQEFLNAR